MSWQILSIVNVTIKENDGTAADCGGKLGICTNFCVENFVREYYFLNRGVHYNGFLGTRV
jgi:hypothetical protein